MANRASLQNLHPKRASSDIETSLEEKIRYQLTASGERERIKELLAKKLKECGWRDEIKQLCQDYVVRRGRENVTVDDVVRAVRPAGRTAVPDTVKAELLLQIKTFINSIPSA